MLSLRRIAACAALLALIIPARAQDDLEKMLDSMNSATPPPPEEVTATFKANKIINAHSIETVKGGTLDFRVTHRFGNIGGGSGGGAHTLWGFDNSDDIRISFDYGITDHLQVGFARSKRWENLDGSIKWRFLSQTTDNKMPISAVLYSIAAFSPVKEAELYLGVDTGIVKKDAHRLSYVTQLIIARKFNWRLSLELIGSYNHRNFVKNYQNTNNGAFDENGLASVGIGGRFKFTKRFSVIFDYFYNFSPYRTDNPSTPYYNPLGVGFEIETGGHVFTLNLTNARGIIENDFLPNTTDDWLQGGFKFGFNISRVFTIVKPKM